MLDVKDLAAERHFVNLKQPGRRDLNVNNLAQENQDHMSQDLLTPCAVCTSKVPD